MSKATGLPLLNFLSCYYTYIKVHTKLTHLMQKVAVETSQNGMSISSNYMKALDLMVFPRMAISLATCE